MEMKYILYAKTHKIDDAGDTWTFKFQPIDTKYKKKCTFSVTSKDPQETLGELGLPQSYGDTVVLEFGERERQVMLITGDKKAVE